MNSLSLESFKGKALSKVSSMRIVGGDDASGIPTGTEIVLGGGTRPKTTPISSSATHIKSGEEDTWTLEFVEP